MINNKELQDYIVALCNGDKIAFEKIYKELNIPMYTIILRITQDKSLSEDILQEVFVKLYLSPPKTTKNPRAYLFQMAHNLAIDGLRKKPQYADLDDFENIVYLPNVDLSSNMDVDSALKTLPLVESQIVSLHINGNFKFREIADILNIPLGTVIWKYHKAINCLRSHLSGGV